MDYKKIYLKKGEGRILRANGAWVYDNEIERETDGIGDGDVVEIVSNTGFSFGLGVINHASKIRVRLLSRDPHEEINNDFFVKRVRAAWEYRKHVLGEENTIGTKDGSGSITVPASCRVIFGEADMLPGITIDKYSDVLVIESLALGTDRFKGEIIDCLKAILAENGVIIRGVYERSDAKIREKEGLPRFKGFFNDEEFDTNVDIVENGVKYFVDVAEGQKTGFFLDQKYNRLAIRNIAKDAEVLDCFTHTGAFALNAAVAGAKHVTAVDASEDGIAMAKRNAALNGVDGKMDFVVADVFDLLPSYASEGKQFDLVILDPPAFTKSRSSIKKAAKGYKEINMRGLSLVKDGGFLATCSCSHFMDPDLFKETIASAAHDEHVLLRQVYFGTQAPDHPILWADSDSYYLKFYIFQKQSLKA
ncbi:MAG: class I SAM-dependent rRNA methyltransferase [Catonella sp.]|nr:class I SAM-dependent rRNA methyltransferase [Catonella sp.]MDY6356543.1 class I SAM-dependent rRNA methyltransferase [Catonella sp.]